jgi:hypothetical protein
MRRRELLKGAVAGLPVAAGLHLGGARPAAAQAARFQDPVQALNFALGLEYVEAEFFRQGNAAGLLDGQQAAYLEEIAAEEQAHVALLTETIIDVGGTPEAAPGVDFASRFDDDRRYLETAALIERTVVRGHLTALSGVLGDPELVQTLAGVYGVEARHAALTADLAGQPIDGGVFPSWREEPMIPAQVMAALQPYLTDARSMADEAAATQ